MKNLVFFLTLLSFLFSQEVKQKQVDRGNKNKFGVIKVKVLLQHGKLEGPINECRIFIGENISLSKSDIREVRPVILLPVRRGWMYLNGQAKELKRTNLEGIAIFENIPYGKYKIVAAYWKEDAQILEVNLDKEEIEVNFKFVKQ